MRRRLDLAAALVAKPPVLFLDEPTTGLDPRGRLGLWDVIETLVRARAEIVDQIILSSWLHFAEELTEYADLVAVGGYGRGELHPQSDIDLLVLLEGKTERNADEAIGRFLTFLWDIGLEPGHSVRTLDDCEAQARSDVTVLTTLMETRLLHGPGRLFNELPDVVTNNRDALFEFKERKRTTVAHDVFPAALHCERANPQWMARRATPSAPPAP